MTNGNQKTGTKEWAAKNVNIQTGCENNCLYCYARKNALRFGRIKTAEDWRRPVLNQSKIADLERINKPHTRMIVMYPSTHDITSGNLDASVKVLKNYLLTGHFMLIVSKPMRAIIQELVERSDLHLFKERIEFRFTIGSLFDGVLSFWEPAAPNLHDRLYTVFYTLQAGFHTSISCEPLLDPECEIVDYLLEMAPELESIWIGAMNYTKNAPLLDYPAIYRKYKDNPKIKWKESFRRHLPGNSNQVIIQEYEKNLQLPMDPEIMGFEYPAENPESRETTVSRQGE